MLNGIFGLVRDGVVQLNEPGSWKDGQRVLVIALPPETQEFTSPPQELLEDDAREFAPRRDHLSNVNREEL